ncbi:DUF3558 family protein [Nocardia africana]
MRIAGKPFFVDEIIGRWAGLAAVIVVLSLAAATACSDTGSEPAAPSALPTAIPGTFDPCRDIPVNVLESQHLSPEPHPTVAKIGGGGEQSKGCEYWAQHGAEAELGSGVTINVTNVTMEYFAKNFEPNHQFTHSEISGRSVATAGSAGNSYCVMLIALAAGGIEMSNASSRNDSCRILTNVATALISSIPAGA